MLLRRHPCPRQVRRPPIRYVRLMRWRHLAVILSVAFAATSGGAFAAPTADPLTKAIAKLRVAADAAAGYDRDLFAGWKDADGDGCDTRDEVLIAEAVVKPSVGPRCSLTGGRWLSRYDGRIIENASALDIDHMVPLAEAWRSGASAWDAVTRAAFANDLGFAGSLIAVSASSNRSKGDRDPALWLPPRAEALCTYVGDYVATKLRWKLTIDVREKAALIGVANDCRTTTVPAPAAVAGGSAVTPGNAKPESPPPAGVTRYQNCAAARAAGAAPIRRGTPLYDANTHLDRDKDGIACE